VLHVQIEHRPRQSSRGRHRDRAGVPRRASLSRLAPGRALSVQRRAVPVAGIPGHRFGALVRLRSVLRLAGPEPDGAHVLPVRSIRDGQPVAQGSMGLPVGSAGQDRDSPGAGGADPDAGCLLSGLPRDSSRSVGRRLLAPLARLAVLAAGAAVVPVSTAFAQCDRCGAVPVFAGRTLGIESRCGAALRESGSILLGLGCGVGGSLRAARDGDVALHLEQHRAGFVPAQPASALYRLLLRGRCRGRLWH
jgi:hypothetical protein